MATKGITKTAIDALKPGALRQYDALTPGLFLQPFTKANPTRHAWRYEYTSPTRNNPKRPTQKLQRMMTIGDYPSVTIAQARADAGAAATLRERGIDPMDQRETDKARKVTEAANQALTDQGMPGIGTFGHWATLLQKEKAAVGAWKASYTDRFARDLKLRVLPHIAHTPIIEVTPKLLRGIIRALTKATDEHGNARINTDGSAFVPDIAGAKRAMSCVSEVCAMALREEVIDANPVAMLGDRSQRAELIDPHDVQPATVHHDGVVVPEELRALMRRLSESTELVRVISWVSAQTAQRPRMVTSMEHTELDLDAGMWVVPAEKLKRKRSQRGVAHTIPLSRQTCELLRAWIATQPASAYVFPNRDDASKPVARDVLNESLRRARAGGLAVEHKPHGFRATFRTMAQERLGCDGAALEMHLAHINGSLMKELVPTGGMGRTYARLSMVTERRVIAQQWSDYVDAIVLGKRMPAADTYAKQLAQLKAEEMREFEQMDDQPMPEAERQAA